MKIKYKHIVLVVAFAIIVNVVGALIKILHYAIPMGSITIGGTQILTLGSILWILVAILLIVKALTAKESDNLNK